jgi:hypothetical protein
MAAATAGHAKMHDFCLTLPYGLLVALGGLAGFLAKGTAASLLCAARPDAPQAAFPRSSPAAGAAQC